MHNEVTFEGRNPAKRYVNTTDTSLESQEAQTAAADPLIQDILRRLSKVDSILSTLLGQAYDNSGTEGSRITLPDLLSRVAKLEEVANSATCVADTSHTSTSFPIEETTSFESLLIRAIRLVANQPAFVLSLEILMLLTSIGRQARAQFQMVSQ